MEKVNGTVSTVVNGHVNHNNVGGGNLSFHQDIDINLDKLLSISAFAVPSAANILKKEQYKRQKIKTEKRSLNVETKEG